MADLSSIIDYTPATPSTGVKGIDLPDGVTFTFKEPRACLACPKGLSGDTPTHKCIEGLGLNPDNMAANQAALFAIQNSMISNLQRLQVIKELMRFAAHGVDMGSVGQNLINSTVKLTYKVTVVSGTTVTCILQADDMHPKHVIYTVVIPNPSWPAPGVGAVIPIDTDIEMSAGGIITFNNSQLLFHKGIRVNRIIIPEGLEVGGTFQLILDSPASSLATTKYPADEDAEPTISYEFYVGRYREEDTYPKPIVPVYGIEVTKDIPTPLGGAVIILEAASFVSRSNRFRAYQILNGAEVDISALVLPNITVTYESGHYVTKLNTAGIDMSTATALRLRYWKQATDNNREYIGTKTCTNYVIDPSGTHEPYCRVRNTATQIAKFHTDCHLSDCSGFALDVPTSPLSQTIYNQLGIEYPWIAIQKFVGYSDEPELKRIGASSFRSLIGEQPSTPEGYHDRKTFESIGGWQSVNEGPLLEIRPGYEFYYEPGLAFGPAGGNIENRESGCYPIEPTLVNQSALMMSAPDIHAYSGAISGGYGRYQRLGLRVLDLVIPNIQFTAGAYTFPGGTIYDGMWNTQFNVVTESPTYRTKIVLNKLDPYNRTGNHVWQTQKGIVVVFSYDYDSSTKQYTLHLKNQTITASSIVSAGEERETSWQSSGMNVALPYPCRINNWSCAQSTRGPMSNTVQIGEAITINGKNFLIVNTVAASGDVQTWAPSAFTSKTLVGQSPIRIAVPDGSTVTSVVVARDGDMADITGPYAPGFLAKDQFWWRQIGNAVIFKFSNYNYTNNPIDYFVDITIHTSLGDVVVGGRDILLGDSGAYAQCHYTWNADADKTFQTILAVRYKYVDVNGDNQFTNLTPTSAKPYLSQYADNQYSAVMSPSSCAFAFSGNLLVSGSVEIEVQFQANGPVDDATFFDQQVLTLHAASFPTVAYNGMTYAQYGKRSDVIVVQDENGWIKDWLDDGNTFTGEFIPYGPFAVAHPDKPVMKTATANSEAEDVVIGASGITYFGASGEIYIVAERVAGSCVYIENLKFADTRLMSLAKELISVRTMVERALG